MLFNIMARALTTALTISISITAFAQSKRVAAPSPATPGPFAVQTAEYKFPSTLDTDVLSTAQTELWARAFWPTDLSTDPKTHPIVFLLHGNHSTCGEGHPRVDSDCSYTQEGVCPAGQVITPNHEGYNYLGQQLASLGYIAVTINANRGITCGAGSDADWGLNLARGRLVLRHIEEWMKWATQGGAPTSLGLSETAFLGKVDFTNVGLMGHSRGGEGMRAALAQYRDAGSIWPARIPNLKIRGIFEIGSVDGQAGRVLDADDTAWNQLLPMCDGDVSNLEGRLPFERMLKKSVETRKTPKSLTMVYGANHNFFNSEWTTDDAENGSGCFEHKEIHGTGPVSLSQQAVAATELSAFMLANVGPDRQPEMGRLFDPSYLVPNALSSVTRIDRDHIFTFDRTFTTVVDDFDQVTGTSSNHKSNIASGIKIKNDQTEVPARAVVSWGSASRRRFTQLNMEDKGSGREISAFTSLDLRVGRPMDTVKDNATDFSIALVDAKDRVLNSVPVSNYAELTGPGNETDLYQTVRIPVSDFAVPVGTLIRGVRLIFDRSSKGSLHITNVRFASNNPLAFVGSLNAPLPPQTILPIPKREVISEDENEDANLSRAMAIASGDNLPINKPPPAPPAPGFSSAAERFGQFGVGASPVVSSARVLRLHPVNASKYLAGRAAGMEIAVGSQRGFPVEAQLPTLVMANQRFSVSRYAPTGKIDTLIFTLSRDEFANLPDTGPMYVQYGRINARKFWQMPNYTKSELRR